MDVITISTLQIKKNIIKDFKDGLTTNELIVKYGYSKSTINEWLRPTRLKIETDNLKTLSLKYSKLKKECDSISIELEIYKNLKCLPSSPRLERLNAIEKYYNVYPVKTMCRILDIKIGTFYNHLNRRVPEKSNITNDNFLRPLVLKVFNDSKQRFGSTKIAQKLRNYGYTISNKKAKQLMNELDISPVLGKKPKKQTIEVESKNEVFKNRIGYNFTRKIPNEVWASDVTEVNVLNNVFFVCVILDLFSRKVIGYRVHCKNNTNLLILTLKDAFENRNAPKNVIVHSDRGSNYTSSQYRNLLKSLSLIKSYSKTAKPTQNAVIESFFSHFKEEEVYRQKYNTLEELQSSVNEYVNFFNEYRPHHHLKGQTPNDFEIKYLREKELTSKLSEQHSLTNKIKKTFSSGQLYLKGSKVFV